MRLGRLVAAGLVAGVTAGFLAALLRPRAVQPYGSVSDRPVTGYRGDPDGLVALPESRVVGERLNLARSAPVDMVGVVDGGEVDGDDVGDDLVDTDDVDVDALGVDAVMASSAPRGRWTDG